jgi:hypothetical protein
LTAEWKRNVLQHENLHDEVFSKGKMKFNGGQGHRVCGQPLMQEGDIEMKTKNERDQP